MSKDEMDQEVQARVQRWIKEGPPDHCKEFSEAFGDNDAAMVVAMGTLVTDFIEERVKAEDRAEYLDIIAWVDLTPQSRQRLLSRAA